MVAAVILASPKAVVPPTAPVNVTAPVPAPIVKARADELLFNVFAKTILLLVVFRVLAAPNVTASL